MNRLNNADRAKVVRCLVDGNSIRATVRITGVAKNTVTKLLVGLGAACSEYLDRIMVNLSCERMQVDEIWAFCYCKAKNVTPEIAEQRIAGDIWIFAVIDADSKLIPCWALGPRDADTASALMLDLSRRLQHRIQLTSDGHKAYLFAVIDVFADDIDYAQLVKVYGRESAEEKRRYSPPECIAAKPEPIIGDPDPKHISTSYIERQNLTMRMCMRRFTRLTNAFSKKVENHHAAVALHLMYYNFAKVHQTLKTTPAVKAGIAAHVWTIEEIVALMDSKTTDRAA